MRLSVSISFHRAPRFAGSCGGQDREVETQPGRQACRRRVHGGKRARNRPVRQYAVVPRDPWPRWQRGVKTGEGHVPVHMGVRLAPTEHAADALSDCRCGGLAVKPDRHQNVDRIVPPVRVDRHAAERWVGVFFERRLPTPFGSVAGFPLVSAEFDHSVGGLPERRDGRWRLRVRTGRLGRFPSLAQRSLCLRVLVHEWSLTSD